MSVVGGYMVASNHPLMSVVGGYMVANNHPLMSVVGSYMVANNSIFDELSFQIIWVRAPPVPYEGNKLK